MCLLSCGKDVAEPVIKTEDSIELSLTELDFGPEGGTLALTVHSSGPWRISGYSEWCTPSVTDGNDGDEIAFTAEKVQGNSTEETVFKLFSGSAVETLHVKLHPSDWLELAMEDPDVVLPKGTTPKFQVKVRTNLASENIDVGFSGEGSQWLSNTAVVNSFGYLIYEFRANMNMTYMPRVSEIVFSAEGQSLTVPVYQEQTDMISLDKEYQTLQYESLDEQTVELTVKSNIGLEPLSSEPWLTASDGGIISEPDDKGLSERKLLIHLDEAAGTRAGSITLAYGTSTSQKVNISVTQKNPDPVMVTIEDRALRLYLNTQKWVIAETWPGTDPVCEIAEKGLISTELEFSGNYNVNDIAGLGVFPKLESIIVNGGALKTIDISDCKNIKSFKPVNVMWLNKIVTGDNPISSIRLSDNINGSTNYLSSVSLTIAGNNLTDIDVASTSSAMRWSDKCKTLDVSGCPSLQSLNAVRKWENTYTGEWKAALNTIKISVDQKVAIDAGILIVEKFEGTELLVE